MFIHVHVAVVLQKRASAAPQVGITNVTQKNIYNVINHNEIERKTEQSLLMGGNSTGSGHGDAVADVPVFDFSDDANDPSKGKGKGKGRSDGDGDEALDIAMQRRLVLAQEWDKYIADETKKKLAKMGFKTRHIDEVGLYLDSIYI